MSCGTKMPMSQPEIKNQKNNRLTGTLFKSPFKLSPFNIINTDNLYLRIHTFHVLENIHTSR